MEIKAEIGQIIKWEEKEKYFFQTDFGDEIVDLLHLTPIGNDKIKWYDRIFLLYPMRLLSKKKRWKYLNFMFTQEIFNKKGSYKMQGLPLFVKRPNNFKVGDVVKINYEIENVGSLE